MKNNEALNRMIGKTVSHINNYDDIGIVEIFFNDESCIHIAGNGNANTNSEPELRIMIVEPREPKVTEINTQKDTYEPVDYAHNQPDLGKMEK